MALGLGLVSFALAAVTLGPGWAAIFTGPELAAVEADPMTDLDLSGAEEISRRHLDADYPEVAELGIGRGDTVTDAQLATLLDPDDGDRPTQTTTD